MKRIGMLIVLILLLLGLVRPVRADVAPPPPPEGASIAPGAVTTQVRMVSETVLVDIAQNKTSGAVSGPAKARVTASFQMRNLGTAAETMEARFPLNSLSPNETVDEQSCKYPDFFPVISDFTASVDGKPARVTNHNVFLDNSWTGKPGKQVACWASFSVQFEPGKDVAIQVRYTVEGYYSWRTNNLVTFYYVLMTGSGWKDTIGSADVTFRLPIPLTPETLFEYQPQAGQQATINGNEVRFHFENFEPNFNPNISIMDPALWQRIQKETANVQKNPQDGEAWGRLGKAYKEAILMGRGYRWDDTGAGAGMYQKSKDAYEKAVTLLPKDADWHGGYAELLWNNVIFPSYGSRADQRDDLVKAAEQVRLALAINPNQAQAKGILEDMDRWTQYDQTKGPLVEIVNGKPVFLALTATPTAPPEAAAPTTPPTPPPTAPPPASPTAVDPTVTGTLPDAPTPVPTDTLAAPAETPLAVSEVEASPTPLPATPAAASKPQGSRGLCGAGLVPVGFVLAWIGRRRFKR